MKLKSWLLRLIILALLALILSSLDWGMQEDAATTLFTVIGIIYTLAVGFMLGFSFQEINDDKLRAGYVSIIKDAFSVFTILFGILAVLHSLCPDFSFHLAFLKFSYDYLVVVLDLYTLAYYCYNFNKLRRLRNDMDDCIRQGRIDKEKHGNC